MRRKRVLVTVAALVALAAVGGTVWATLSNRPPEVTLAEVVREDLSVTVVATGRVEADERADIVPPTAGTLETIEVSDGQRVRAGQVVAQMDTEPLEAQLRQAEAAERAARAQLRTVRAGGPTQDQIAAADEAVATARDGYEQAQAAAAALEKALAQVPEDITGQAGVDTGALTDVLVGQAYGQYQQALAQREGLNVDTSGSEDAAQAQVDQAAEQVRLAKETIEKATLTAPIDGVVLFNSVSAAGISAGSIAGGAAAGGSIDVSSGKPVEGSAVAPQQPPFTVIQLESLRFSAEVDEAEIARVKAGLAADVRLDAFEDRSFETTVARILPKAQSTGTGGTVFPVLMALADTGSRILVGMQGDATIRVRTVEDAVTVPVEALQESDGRQFVYVVSDGRLRRRRIETGVLTETRVQVVGGVRPGDDVVTSGPEEMRDGMRVTTAGG